MIGFQCCTDMETWLHDFASDQVFRYWVYKRLFTPEEMEVKYCDQSFFENDVCCYGRIRMVVDIGNGDWLIGFERVEDGLEEKDEIDYLEYYRLSNIHIDWSLLDNKVEDDDESNLEED